MPSPSDILAGLTRIANDAFPLALLWHLATAIVLALLLRGWRPTNRTAALLLAAPLASVAALAWGGGNPFNGAVFTVLAATVAALALRLRDRVARGPAWSSILGAGMVALGWLYPHFLERDPIAYLYGSPLGLIPCPTLALVIGVTLIGGGLGGRALPAVLGAVGTFYAVFGALRLGVALDLLLLAGAAGLLVLVAPRLRTA